jgi:hypothetical protein
VKKTRIPPKKDPAQPLPNPRQERFAHLQAAGRTGGDAYAEVYGARFPAAYAHGARLRMKSHVMNRVRYLQTGKAQTTVMDLREILKFLTRVKRTSAGRVGPHSDLVRRYRVRRNGRKKVVWMLNKRACIELAARLQGHLRRGIRKPSVEAERRKRPPASAAQPLQNPRHEAFARLIASGRNGRQAYGEVYQAPRECARANAVKLRARPEIDARIRRLQIEAVSGSIMNLREILEFLTKVKRTAPADLKIDSELVERLDCRRARPELRMPSKLACVELAARLLGYLPFRKPTCG